MGYRLLISIVVLITVFGFTTQTEEPLSLEQQAIVSASRGATWLLEYPEEFKDPGILWVLNSINEKYCEPNISVTREIDGRLETVQNHPIEYAYLRLFDPTAQHQLTRGILSERKKYFDDILVPSLYCDIEKIPLHTESTIRTYSNQSGYTLTHAFLALLWMKDRGCLNESLSDLLKQTALSVSKEQNSSPLFGDLFAERTAFLLYGDYKNLVHENWIKNIVDAQEYSGGWSTKQGSMIFGTEENPHTSVLSMWALVQYTNECPFE
jgi:hypothetical protein